MSISWDTALEPMLRALQEVWPIRRSTESPVRRQCHFISLITKELRCLPSRKRVRMFVKCPYVCVFFWVCPATRLCHGRALFCRDGIQVLALLGRSTGRREREQRAHRCPSSLPPGLASALPTYRPSHQDWENEKGPPPFGNRKTLTWVYSGSRW